MASLTEDEIPRVDAMAAELDRATGWNLEIVLGLILVDDFFTLPGQPHICTGATAGTAGLPRGSRHVPRHLRPHSAAHGSRIRSLHAAFRRNRRGPARTDDPVLRLQRLYWFFVEFGFVEQNGLPMVFGAGIMSSHGETHHAWDLRADLVEVYADGIMSMLFTTTEIQTTHFLIDDVEVIWQMNDWFAAPETAGPTRAYEAGRPGILERQAGAEPTVYGEGPNVFFAEQLAGLTPGRILPPGDRGRRKCVHAAEQGVVGSVL